MPREGLAASQLPQHARVTSRAQPAQTLAGRQQFLLIEAMSENADLLKPALHTLAGSRSTVCVLALASSGIFLLLVMKELQVQLYRKKVPQVRAFCSPLAESLYCSKQTLGKEGGEAPLTPVTTQQQSHSRPSCPITPNALTLS